MKYLRSENGFTIVELMTVLLLTGIISVSAVRFLLAQQRQTSVRSDQSYGRRQVNLGLHEIMKSLRSAGANLPPDVTSLHTSNSNPDTVTIRYAESNSGREWRESKYFIAHNETTPPCLMKLDSDGSLEVIAHGIDDLQLRYILATADTVDVVQPGDRVLMATVQLQSCRSQFDKDGSGTEVSQSAVFKAGSTVMIRNTVVYDGVRL